jgi:hypothetical protein
MILLDVIKLSEKTTVVVDCHMLEPTVAARITTHDKAIFLFANHATIRNENFARQDKQDLLGVISTLSDPEKIREHVLDVVCETSTRKLEQVKASNFKHK